LSEYAMGNAYGQASLREMMEDVRRGGRREGGRVVKTLPEGVVMPAGYEGGRVGGREAADFFVLAREWLRKVGWRRVGGREG